MKIELRDPPTRRFTDVRPSWWLRHGTALIFLAFLAAAVVILLLPWPHSGGRTLFQLLTGTWIIHIF